jgi:hypothetical protein
MPQISLMPTSFGCSHDLQKLLPSHQRLCVRLVGFFLKKKRAWFELTVGGFCFVLVLASRSASRPSLHQLPSSRVSAWIRLPGCGAVCQAVGAALVDHECSMVVAHNGRATAEATIHRREALW